MADSACDHSLAKASLSRGPPLFFFFCKCEMVAVGSVGSAGGLTWRTQLVITHWPEPRYREAPFFFFFVSVLYLVAPIGRFLRGG